MKISRRHHRYPLRIKVARTISEFPAQDWNKVFPAVLEGYDFFKTLDESGVDQFSFYYIMVYEGKTPILAAPCFLMKYSLDTSINGPLRRATNAIKKIMPNIFGLTAFICGMPIGPGHIGINGGDPEKIMRVFLRKLEQLAKKNRASVVAFKDFPHSYTAVLDPLQKNGFVKIDSLPTTELNVWFKNFEEYLKTLSGANRYDMRRKFKKIDGHVKFDMDVVSSLDDATLKDVYKLYLDIVGKHDMGFEILPMSFFGNITKNMPDKAKFFLWRLDGKLVVFLFCLISDELLLDYYVGMDYEIAHKYHLYFVKFRDTLNWCIKHKIPKYDMGYTGYEPKRRLGFDFVPLYIYARLRNRLLSPVFKFVCQLLKFENFDPALKEGKDRKRNEK